MPTISQRLATIPSQKKSAIWSGPCGEGKQGGITFSLLCRFLHCRERFRLLMVEGLKAPDRFNHKLEYGNMWHVCEEALASERNHFGEVVGTTLWSDNLEEYLNKLFLQYPFDREDSEKWYWVCKKQFPQYVNYWAKHKDVVNRKPLLSEQVFNVPYALPSGRTVRLRGKWDSVDLVEEHVEDHVRVPAGIWLMENKTKGEVDRAKIIHQLRYDLQTMMYMTSLTVKLTKGEPSEIEELRENPVVGIRYNVIRRPLSGGKGTITQKQATKGVKCTKCKGKKLVDTLGGTFTCPKCHGYGRINAKPAEKLEDYYNRLAQYIKNEPETYFFRWNVPITVDDIARFRRETLDPILEQLCDWWEFVASCQREPENLWKTRDGMHWRHPFGVRGFEDGVGDEYDPYFENGSTAGLVRVTNLFPELQE